MQTQYDTKTFWGQDRATRYAKRAYRINVGGREIATIRAESQGEALERAREMLFPEITAVLDPDYDN